MINLTFLRAVRALAIVSIAFALMVAPLAGYARPASQIGAADFVKKGDDLFKAGKYREAIEAYKEALKVDPNNDQAVGYIAYSYNKLGDSEQARQWMKRRVEIPGQTPSRKAQVLTDMMLLYWDQAHLYISAHLAASNNNSKPEELAAAKKLVAEGIESGQKAVTIAPRSIKAFNLLNLLYRAVAAVEPETAAKKDMIAKADDALRKSIGFFESNASQQTSEMWTVPTISAINGTNLGEAVRFGAATAKPSPDEFKSVKDERVVVEVIVGRDGKVRLPRVLYGQGKLADTALVAARQWEFEPSTFDGRAVQVIQSISFPVK